MANLSRLEEEAVPVFITQEIQQIARQFAKQQPNGAKAQQVELNTLAVCAVNNYLKILGIPVNLSNCDSWNPFAQMTTNVADLEIVELGRIECRPVSRSGTTEPVCYVPTEAQCDRIAYVVVDVEPNRPDALILGFTDQVDGEELPLSHLRPISELPVFIDQYDPRTVSERVNRLTGWLQGQINAGWQTLNQVLDDPFLDYQWRSAKFENDDLTELTTSRLIRAKTFDFLSAQQTETVILLAELYQESAATTDLGIELKLFPPEGQTFLPAGLVMTVLDEAGDPVLQAQTRDENRMIDLGFHAEVGDRFTLRIELGKMSVDEHFIV